MVIGNGFFSDTLSDAIKEMQRISQCEVVQCAFPTIGNIMYYISYNGDIFGMQTIGGKRLTRNRKTTKNKGGISARLTKEDGIGIQPAYIEEMQFLGNDEIEVRLRIAGGYDSRHTKEDPIIDGRVIAANDGLVLRDWLPFFKGHNLMEPLAIIHFTKFRY